MTKTLNWLKEWFYIPLVALYVLTIVLIYWFNYAGAQFLFSKTHTDWGAFGSYLSGTLTPFLSFITLMGFLYTLRQQIRDKKKQSEKADQIKFEENIFRVLPILGDSIDKVNRGGYAGKQGFIKLAEPIYNDILNDFKTAKVLSETQIAARLQSHDFDLLYGPYINLVVLTLEHIEEHREKPFVNIRWCLSIIIASLPPSAIKLLIPISKMKDREKLQALLKKEKEEFNFHRDKDIVSMLES